MNIELEPGRYVVAVSGGVDSMALLDMLRQLPGVKLTVAHYDHGIRADSAEDRRLVAAVAREHGLPFVYAEGKLGSGASEATARRARYEFLHAVRKTAGAHAVVTAHHQDDVLETAILNILRGTGRKGLSSLRSTDTVKRPLLHMSKQELRNYAESAGLKWREDSTNADEAYTRNYIRQRLLAQFTPEQRAKLQTHLDEARGTNAVLDGVIAGFLAKQPAPDKLNRHQFIMLPHAVAREVMAAWLRANGIAEFDRRTIERLVWASKTYADGKRANITHGHWLQMSRRLVAII